MTIADIKKNAETKMGQSIEALKNNLSRIRTGRASTSLLDRITVDYYGMPTPVKQVANVAAPEPRMITIAPWEPKMLGEIEKAILKSDLGLNPAANGDVIRVPMPALTEERRRDLTKVVKGEAENARVAVRNIRRDANNDCKNLLKDKSITEDEERRAQDDIQKLTDKYIVEVDKALAEKEKELMAV